jgi:hypothetical protein
VLSIWAFHAVSIHQGSAESKDSDDRMEAKIDRIVEKSRCVIRASEDTSTDGHRDGVDSCRKPNSEDRVS